MDAGCLKAWHSYWLRAHVECELMVPSEVPGLPGLHGSLAGGEIYDTAGNLVWQREAQGAEAAWHTEGLDGPLHANGVCLYKANVEVMATGSPPASRRWQKQLTLSAGGTVCTRGRAPLYHCL